MNHLLAIDQGTSSTRAIIYDIQGDLIASSQYPIKQYYPEPGWVEHDPEEIWRKTHKAIQDVFNVIPITSVIACGITNQRETTLLWNKKTGRCISPAIVWQDRRTEAYCASLKNERVIIHDKTGLYPDPYFSASKLRWLLEYNIDAKSLANEGNLAFGTIDSYLIWRLTNGSSHVTDSTNASRTMLYNIHQHRWDEDLLKLFSIPKSVLPDVYSCDAHFGVIDKKWFGTEIPITGVAGDQQAALIGQACINEGMIKATYGTGGFLLLNTGSKPVSSKHQLLTTIAYEIQNKVCYGLEGSIYHAGTTIKWLRDQLGLFSDSDTTEVLAASLKSNEGVYLVSSFTGLGAPHWLSTSGAQIIGLSLKSSKAHFARAALENVAYQTRDILSCMHDDSSEPIVELRADGGMSHNKWFLQFLANQCQLRVQQANHVEATAKGAALLAALGIGALNNLSDFDTMWSPGKEILPAGSLEQANIEYAGWLKALKHIS